MNEIEIFLLNQLGGKERGKGRPFVFNKKKGLLIIYIQYERIWPLPVGEGIVFVVV
jgi:hypothetical protein